MPGFRSLGDDEDVEFECKVSDKGLEATAVTGPEGESCKGSHRRPMSKKRFRKIRCYNCGEFANHIAAKCTLGPQPKRCHHCKSVDHLIADCPLREERKKNPGGSKTKNGDATAATKDGANHTGGGGCGGGGDCHHGRHDDEEEDEDQEELADADEHRQDCSSSSSSCGTGSGSSVEKRKL